VADFDNQSKRFSGISLLGIGRPLPNPDGTIAQGDRYHFLGLYSGIALAPVDEEYGDVPAGDNPPLANIPIASRCPQVFLVIESI
jgi:hypothetical protein